MDGRSMRPNSIAIGDTKARLTVLAFVHVPGRRNAKLKVQCSCGTIKEIWTANFSRGDTYSCGCLRKELKIGQFVPKHKDWNCKEYRAWASMRNRCLNRTNKNYDAYGGRGITIDKDWDEYLAFLADMGRAPTPKHSLGRIDNDGPYSKENCRWETSTQQNSNKYNSHLLTIDGVTKTAAEWCRVLNMTNYQLLKKYEWGEEANA